MEKSLLVMAGAAIGGLGRYHLGRLALHMGGVAYPWGTLAANLLGGLAMGLLAGWLSARGGSESIRLFAAVGVLGGFTTFSAFSLEMMLMLDRGAYVVALGYALISVIGAIAALAIGLGVMRGIA